MILPSYSPLKDSPTFMNLLIEQPDNYFLMYIQNKFKLLFQKDTTVSLFNDEIHLKPFFDYKDGNIVVLSDISNETATCAFAFIISSVFLWYKDILHVMPTKCLRVENLFYIVKRIKIGLDEIGFWVQLIIML